MREVLERFKIRNTIDQLEEKDLLYQTIQKFSGIDLRPHVVTNHEMGTIFEELLRKFNEQTNENPGEHFTPREVILLMARLVLNGDKDILQREGVLRSVYDPVCGTGGMLSIAEDYIHEAMNPTADIRLYGQEINDETYAVCVSDMLIKGDDEGAKNIKPRSTFSNDGHPGRTFDYMLCNPPYGKDWKKEKTFIEEEADRGYAGRFGAGTPRTSPPDVSEEDRINAEVERTMKTRGRLQNVSFFAFTATPKSKTLEIFGTRRDDGSYAPFSLYSMRQAIEEGFILDVLKNYTTFRVYFGLNKKVQDDPRYEKIKAIALLKSYADLHEHGIRMKTQQIIEHFHEQVKDRIGGKAKAMLVTRSRLHAVRYSQAFERYLKERGYPHRVLVAFSGTVRDPETHLEYTEVQMNGLPETQTAETFKGLDYRFLIVANKFQTGFDQPLLHTMYADKKLGGVNAVQTLSRLNRTYPGKEETFVLDFANSAEEIQKSFQRYYETTLLTEPTDPNKLYDLKHQLQDYRIFGGEDVEAFARVYFSEKGDQQHLHAVLDPVVEEYVTHEEEELVGFRKHLEDYVRLYAFLSQILTFTDAELEKLYQFARFLLRKLPVPERELPVEITENINMDSYRIQETSKGDIRLIEKGGELKPISEIGTGQIPPEDIARLSEILGYINEYYGIDFTDEDKVEHFAQDMERRISGNNNLIRAFDPEVNPSPEHRRDAFDPFFEDVLHEMIDSNFDLYKKIVEDTSFGDLFKEFVFEKVESSLRAGRR